MSKYYYDKEAAEHPIKWIESYCTHVKGEKGGEPLVLMDWIKKVLRDVFGTKRKSDGKRRYRKVYIEIPRKNAKSTYGGAIALYMLGALNEYGAEIYSAATDRLQAGIIFDQIAKPMVEQNPTLSKHFKIWRNSIECRGGFYKAISGETKGKHGYNASGVIFDEVHEQPNEELYDTLMTSQGSRSEPITWMFTTAGHDTQSLCYRLHEYAINVNNGTFEDDTFYGIIFNASKELDIHSEETWKTAMPGYGISVKKDFIKDEIQRVKNEPSFESTFRRLYLNQWVGSVTTWIPDDKIIDCMNQLPDDLSKYPCYCGLDLSKNRDLTAFSKVWYDDLNDRYYIDVDLFCPEETLYRRKIGEGVDYLVWSRDGHIIATPGNVIDNTFIYNHVMKFADKYNVDMLSYDRMFATDMIIRLSEQGIPVNAHGQGFISMTEPTRRLETIIYDNETSVIIKSNPVIRWMFGNVMIKHDDADNVKISKDKSKEKVDGIVAIVMALGGMPKEFDKISVYRDKDLLIL